MQKRHAPSEVHGLTLCGYECTPSEFEAMRRRGTKFVSCKRCLNALDLRELIKDDEI
jgi:hypothetical protein